jgi:NADH-quinone oxidoreductase subunit G
VAAADLQVVRGEDGLRLASVTLGGVTLSLAVVHGLQQARQVVERVRRGELAVDLVEVMACPGGCIGGAGQPVTMDGQARKQRTRSLYEVDKRLDLHKSQDNHYVREAYRQHLGEIGGSRAHRLLHTRYVNRRAATSGAGACGAPACGHPHVEGAGP